MNEVIVLPQEVEVIARAVSPEKKQEVQIVLNQVFDGVSKMRKQLDVIEVADENDSMGMKLANQIRLGVRGIRLDAEKVFDRKREEVQQAMIGYKTEDQLWLKAKQTMQILTKEIEETAKWKETTKDRIEAERHELKIHQRMQQVLKFSNKISRAEYDKMGDDTFAAFLSGIKKQYNDRIEAERKAEAERIATEKAEAEERERIRKENEALRAKADAEAKARKEAEEKIEQERRAAQAAVEAAAKKAAAEKAKLEAEIRAKEAAEQAARKEAERKELEAKKAAESAAKKAANAPDKEKILEFAAMLGNIQTPDVKGEEAKRIIAEAVKMLDDVYGLLKDGAASL